MAGAVVKIKVFSASSYSSFTAESAFGNLQFVWLQMGFLLRKYWKLGAEKCWPRIWRFLPCINIWIKLKCKFNVWSIFGPWLGVCCYLTKHVTSQVLFSHVFDFERGNTLWWIDTTASQLRHILTPKKATLHHVNIQIYKSQGTTLMRIMEAYIIVPCQFLKWDRD